MAAALVAASRQSRRSLITTSKAFVPLASLADRRAGSDEAAQLPSRPENAPSADDFRPSTQPGADRPAAGGEPTANISEGDIKLVLYRLVRQSKFVDADNAALAWINNSSGTATWRIYRLMILVTMRGNIAVSMMWMQRLLQARLQLDPPIPSEQYFDVWLTLLRRCLHLQFEPASSASGTPARSRGVWSLHTTYSIFRSEFPINEIVRFTKQPGTDRTRNVGYRGLRVLGQVLQVLMQRSSSKKLLESLLSDADALEIGLSLQTGLELVRSLDPAVTRPFLDRISESALAESPETRDRVIVMYNQLLTNYIRHARLDEANQLFDTMQNRKLVSCVTFRIIIRSCIQRNDYFSALLAHREMVSLGLPNVVTESRVTAELLSRIGQIDEAIEIIGTILSERDRLEREYCAALDAKLATKTPKLRRELKEAQLCATYAYNNVIHSVARLNLTSMTERLFANMCAAKLMPSPATIIPILCMYARQRMFDKCRTLLVDWFRTRKGSVHHRTIAESGLAPASSPFVASPPQTGAPHQGTSTLELPSALRDGAALASQAYSELKDRPADDLVLISIVYGTYFSIFSPFTSRSRELRADETLRDLSERWRNKVDPASPLVLIHLQPYPVFIEGAHIAESLGPAPQSLVGFAFVNDIVSRTGLDFGTVASAVVQFHAHNHSSIVAANKAAANGTPTRRKRTGPTIWRGSRSAAAGGSGGWTLKPEPYNESRLKALKRGEAPPGREWTWEQLPVFHVEPEPWFHYEQAEGMFVMLQNEGYDLAEPARRTLLKMYRDSGHADKADAVFATWSHTHEGKSAATAGELTASAAPSSTGAATRAGQESEYGHDDSFPDISQLLDSLDPFKSTDLVTDIMQLAAPSPSSQQQQQQQPSLSARRGAQ
ncbi:hypothetical protein HK105_205320 [Polyrhizophydium stewartii]|uniref:Uncharacterized protein n=1 Tax=Polyrhizophydium stewartii TaxID=2732419 RepID=A0ABR4N6N9_9FUNG